MIGSLSRCPDKVWTTYITYVWTLESGFYVTIFIDLIFRQVADLSITVHMLTSVCVNALKMAFWRRKSEPSLVQFGSEQPICQISIPKSFGDNEDVTEYES